MHLRPVHTLILAFALTTFTGLAAVPSSAMSFADLVISEVLSSPGDPAIGETPFDANNDGVNDSSFMHLSGDEFVEIWNSGSTDIMLDGVQLFDADFSTSPRYTFGSVTLAAGAYFVIFGNSADPNFTDPVQRLFQTSAAGLVDNPISCELCASNSGDEFTLKAADGTVIDSFAVPAAFAGESFTRNEAGEIVRHSDLSSSFASPGMSAVVTPEPATAVMLGIGLFGCGLFGRPRR